MAATFSKPYFRRVSLRTVSVVASLRRSTGSFASSKSTWESLTWVEAFLTFLTRDSSRARSCSSSAVISEASSNLARSDLNLTGTIGSSLNPKYPALFSESVSWKPTSRH